MNALIYFPETVFFGWMSTFGLSHASVDPESGTLKPAEVAGGCIAAVGHHR